jgi:two-component system sensor histidine kinase/response regulator
MNDRLSDQSTREKSPEPSTLGIDSRRGLNILLAEDNPMNQMITARLLEKVGHKVSIANNGREAVHAVEMAAANGSRFDVVLMDVQMPEMDGLEATEAIRSREKSTCQHLPIIAMTATKDDRERCIGSGMDEYLSKPINTNDLWHTLDHLALQLEIR